MEVFDDTESIDKIKKQLKKDQKVIDAEIKKLNDDPRDLEYGALHFKYIIDCHGEHRFDVYIKYRKSFSMGASEVRSVSINVEETDYHKELIRSTTIHVTKDSINSVCIVIFGIIMAQWEGLVDRL